MIANKTKKTYQCTNCNVNHPSWRGKCQYCGKWNTISEIEVTPKKKFISKISSKRKAIIEASKGDNDEMAQWFKEQKEIALKSNCSCLECGLDVTKDLISEEIWINRRVHAHILPKKKYPSVKIDINNHLLLCWNCHATFDSSWEKASSMSIFGLAIQKVKTFIHKVNENTSKLPKEFQIQPL